MFNVKHVYFAVMFSMMYTNIGFAWNDKVTHAALSEYAAKNSVLDISKGNYLSNIGFDKGVNEKFIWNNINQEVFKWLREGAVLEDAGTSQEAINGKARFLNHFHNPIKSAPWSNAGLDDTIWVLGIPKYVKGELALVWAQNSAKQAVSVGGDESWKAVRDYYYLALTSTSETDRQANFAQTFRGLGQQIHLIQDMAQPSHVRNDAHPEDALMEGPWYESWLGDERLEFWTKAHQSDKALGFMKQPPVFPTFQPDTILSAFWDTDQYDGTANSISLTKGTTVGLSEYTNANYFSDDTIASPDIRHKFPYPSTNINDYYTCTDNAPAGSKAAKRWYISRMPCQQGFVDHFLASSFLPKPQPDKISPSMLMDSRVYEDYARDLLPRAVGYSAGLINYFFRGKLDMTEDGLGYRIENLSDEDMTGNVTSFKLFYNDDSGNRNEIPISLYDAFGNKHTDPRITLTIPAHEKSPFTVQFTPPTVNPKSYLLVFLGKLDSEENAVIGSIISRLYIIALPVDHETRLTLGKQYYALNLMKGNTLTPISQSQLPFGLLDDGAYWDFNTFTWTAKESSESLGVPLNIGGPQNMAKYKDTANNRVRYILNGSYEKEAWQRFTFNPKDDTDQTIKNINFVTFVGSPLSASGAYNGNTGWMEYTDTGVMSILPKLPVNPGERYFSLYPGYNFNDTFVETPTFNTYNFDGSKTEQNIPQDPDAPMAAIVSAEKTGADCVNISIPSIYPYGSTTGSSGVTYNRLCPGAEPVQYTQAYAGKCSTEDTNCGNIYNSLAGSSNNTIFDIPSSYRSYVRVHRNDGGQYFEELYINGQLIETTPASSEQLESHYQILAVYKENAVVRRTDFITKTENSLSYRYTPDAYRIYERKTNFTAGYYIFIKGKRYDLGGTTDIISKVLTTTPYNETPAPGTTLPVDHLTYQYADDITGYHPDRFFISENTDGSHVLVAFDEYAYNNGQGLVHARRYEPSDSDPNKYILYYDIPATEIQNADHEATRTGRKLLLFRSDGTLKAEIQDPVGLDKTIGSVGILN